MFGNAFSGWHLLIILAVILLLFGAAKLPALAKSMGQSARVFKGEMRAMKDEDVTKQNGAAPGAAPSAEASPGEVRSDSTGTGTPTP
jgi:sec-independent protein translocase protein TatA